MAVNNDVTLDLDVLPPGADLRSVTAEPADVAGRRALRVELTDAVTLHGRAGVDFVDQPTFVTVPVDFMTGVIEVDILSRLNGKGPADARAFAGIAYRISESCDRFEAVYLRPLNGLKVDPPSPRNRRAVQYFCYPDWDFDRLRTEYPDGRYEAPAVIGPDQWITLRLIVTDASVTVLVDGVDVLIVDGPKAPPTLGQIGLFVDIGTEAYFSNLRVNLQTPATK